MPPTTGRGPSRADSPAHKPRTMIEAAIFANDDDDVLDRTRSLDGVDTDSDGCALWACHDTNIGVVRRDNKLSRREYGTAHDEAGRQNGCDVGPSPRLDDRAFAACRSFQSIET